MSKIAEKDLLNLTESLYELAWMPNKADANPLAARLRYTAHNHEYESFKDREALFEAISVAESAAGDARRKEHWLRQLDSIWIPLESRLMESIAFSRSREVREIEV